MHPVVMRCQPTPRRVQPYKNGHLIDGGITSLVPVRFARAMGADFVVAVEFTAKAPVPTDWARPRSSTASCTPRAAWSLRQKWLRPTF